MYNATAMSQRTEVSRRSRMTRILRSDPICQQLYHRAFRLQIPSALDVHPGDARAPGVPLGGGERAAVGKRGPPGAAFLVAGGEVVFSVAVEVAHLHINPGRDGAPGCPLGGGKGG